MRKPFFQKMIDMADDPNTVNSIYEKLQIKIDKDGSVVEK
jgi:hypothetical protein